MSINITIKEMLDYPSNKLTRRREGNLNVYEICAEDFLEFAKEDFKGQDLRSRVNALGNAKRAIECRIDTLLYNFCLHKKVRKKDGIFPERLRLFDNLE